MSDDATRNYENHPGLTKNKSPVEATQLINFNFVNSDDISKIMNLLDPTKKTNSAIPTKIVKLANKQICKDLAKTHKFKKEDSLDKTNHRSISILPTVSKIFKRILFNQLQRFSNKFLSYTTRYPPINLLQE